MGKIDYLPDYLTSDQLEAITHHGSPLLIIAGPGSGKTEVITWRAAHLVRAGRVEPSNLLVTTFTNKAADQLKDRIATRLPGVNVEAMQVSTIHSFCAELLRRYRRNSPLPAGFRLLDEDSQLLLVYAERKALGLDEIVKGRPYKFFDSVIGVFNLATEELVDPDGLLEWCEKQGERCAEKETDLWHERHIVAEAYCRYVDLLKQNSLVDFAFLQRHALTLVEKNPEVLSELHDRYREILIDEYQDTNAAQDKLLGKLAGEGKRLTVVGDDDQSIYRFRGATVRNILSFTKRYPDARIIKLTQNFRSREPIVDHSVKVIEYNPARYKKALQSTRGEGSDLLLIYEKTAAEEAEAVVDQLSRLHKNGFISRWSDVAILLRSVRSYAGPYIDALKEMRIPYHVLGDASFFEREEIVHLYDLYSFLSATKSWGDRFLRTPLVDLSDEAQDVLKEHKDDLLGSASENALQSIGLNKDKDIQKVLALLRLKDKVQAKRHSSLLDVFYALLAATGCVPRFEKAGNEEALANLGIMSRLIANWDSLGNSRNFYAFQRYLKLLREGGVDPVTVPPEDAVQLMTIHQAKGLGFPVVVLGAAMNGRLPSTRRKERYEVPYDMRASGDPEVKDPHTVDERKLFYVAVTRSRDLLIIGTADIVNKRGGGPSDFLFEMFGEDLKGAADLTKAHIEKVLSRGSLIREERKRYSYSDLAYYIQCPIRYRFVAIYGFEAPWLDPVGFGANVHRALEAIHQRAIDGQPTDKEDIVEIVNDVWISGRNVNEEADRKVRRAAVEQIQRYLQEYRETFDRVIRSEEYFAFPLEDRVLTGKFDLLRKVSDKEGVEVVDFKTTGFVDLDTFGINLQLDIYAMGVEQDLQHKVDKRTVHFLRDGEVHSKDWATEHEKPAKDRMNLILNRIVEEDFSPNAAYCKHCDEFNQICPYSVIIRKDEDET